MDKQYMDAYEQALRFLGPRFLSRLELRNKLRRKNYTSDIIEQVIDKLVEMKYVDDERLSELVLKRFMEEAKYGKKYIYHKMQLRGLEPSFELENYDELSAAKEFLLRYFPVEEGPYDQAKIMRKLYNRGFSNDVIYSAYNEIYTSHKT